MFEASRHKRKRKKNDKSEYSLTIFFSPFHRYRQQVKAVRWTMLTFHLRPNVGKAAKVFRLAAPGLGSSRKCRPTSPKASFCNSVWRIRFFTRQNGFTGRPGTLCQRGGTNIPRGTCLQPPYNRHAVTPLSLVISPRIQAF